jgi:hypothetical protein
VYDYNRIAFREASKLSNPLIAVYASMVHLELALKTHDSNLHMHKHDVCRMLAGFGCVTSLVLQLKNRLRSLRCMNIDGKVDHVAYHNYPAIRYLRHTHDHASDASDDHDLKKIVVILQDIKKKLEKEPVGAYL